MGCPPAAESFADLLLPIIDVVPDMDDPPRGFRLVLREIDRFLAARPLPVETSVHHEPAAVVKEAARLMERQERPPDRRHPPSRAPANSQEIVRVDSLLWIETKEHQAVKTFEPMILASGRRFDSPRHPLVEPWFWRGPPSLRTP